MNAGYQIGAWTDLFYKWKPMYSHTNWLVELCILLASNDRLALMSENFSHLHFYNNMVIKKKSNDFVLGRFYNSMALDPQNKEIVFFQFHNSMVIPKKKSFFLKNYFFSVLQQYGSWPTKQGNCIFISFTTVWLSQKKMKIKQKKLLFSVLQQYGSHKKLPNKHIFGPKSNGWSGWTDFPGTVFRV